jgi:hypothetical protein
MNVTHLKGFFNNKSVGVSQMNCLGLREPLKKAHCSATAAGFWSKWFGLRTAPGLRVLSLLQQLGQVWHPGPQCQP